MANQLLPPATGRVRSDQSLPLTWARLPLVVSGLGRTALLEPKAQLVWVDGADLTQEVPNRDSSDYRIDEANLFLLHRYQGKDYVLPGTRADLVSGVANDQTFGKLAGFIGLSWRISGKPQVLHRPGEHLFRLCCQFIKRRITSCQLVWADVIA